MINSCYLRERTARKSGVLPRESARNYAAAPFIAFRLYLQFRVPKDVVQELQQNDNERLSQSRLAPSPNRVLSLIKTLSYLLLPL